MDTKGKYESKLQKIGLSLDAFTTGCLVMCLLFFVPYIAQNGLSVVVWCLPIACLLPFAVMPLAYLLIHRMDTLLFGRYHFAMPVSAFVASPFFVMAFSASGDGPSQACLVFFGALVFVTTVMIYRYCAFSVRARLSGASIVDKSVPSAALGALGAITAVGALVGFWHYDPQTAYLNTAYILAGAVVVFTISQYLITFYGIPRLGGKRVQSVKSVFRAFYGELDRKTYFSALLFQSAYCIIAALIVRFGFELGIGFYRALAVATVAAAVYAVCAIVAAKKIQYRRMALSVVNLACTVVACAALTVVAAVKMPSGGVLALCMIAAAAVGLGGAIAVRQTKLRFLSVKPNITGGVMFILFELTLLAAAAVAMIAAAVVLTVLSATGSVTAFIYGFAFAAACCIAAFILAGKKIAKKAPAPAASFELADTDSSIDDSDDTDADNTDDSADVDTDTENIGADNDADTGDAPEEEGV